LRRIRRYRRTRIWTCANAARIGAVLRRLLAGERTYLSSRRLPIIGPSVTLLSARGPYAEVIDWTSAPGGDRPGHLERLGMGGFSRKATCVSRDERRRHR